MTRPLHTHFYIHNGFYAAAQRIGLDVVWFPDTRTSKDALKPGDCVLSMGAQINHLPKRKDIYFILHNVEDNSFRTETNFIDLQVFTSTSSGEPLGPPRVLWNEKKRTLFQPWGTPMASTEWLKKPNSSSHVDYWVGSVWDNAKGQGNLRTIALYKEALRNHSVTFKQVKEPASSRIWPQFGKRHHLSELGMRDMVNGSAVGASIVGDWQLTNQYVPCRLFKNLSSGQPAASNSDFSDIFPSGMFFDEISQLVDVRLSKSEAENSKMVRDQQRQLSLYTYEAALERIFTVF